MASVGIMSSSKDVDMDENYILDLEYDELAVGPSKRRRKGPGSFSFSFTSCCANVGPDAASQCLSACPCNSDETEGDKSLGSTTGLRFQCLVPAGKASTAKSNGRAHSICHRHDPEEQVGPGYREKNPLVGFPAAVDRDKYKKWACKNDLYEFRTSKYHQTSRSMSFLDWLRAAQAASACTSSPCPET